MLVLTSCLYKDEVINVAVFEAEDGLGIIAQALDLKISTQKDKNLDPRVDCRFDTIRSDITIKDRETLEEIAYNHFEKETLEFFIRDYCELKEKG